MKSKKMKAIAKQSEMIIDTNDYPSENKHFILECGNIRYILKPKNVLKTLKLMPAFQYGGIIYG